MSARFKPCTIPAFTLIELLIVVAIIAILASIAVPNFLDAQVRSKVSRVLSDQRSVAVALNAYVVDYNKPPMDGWVRLAYLITNNAPQASPRGALTTPVAYMTKMPINPFWNPTATGQVGDGGTSVNGYCYLSSYFYSDQAIDTSKIQFLTQCKTAKTRGFHWSYDSPGPNGLYGANQVLVYEPNMYASTLSNGYPTDWHTINGDLSTRWSVLLPYDATNGTKSEGIISYTNKGMFKLQHLAQ